MLSSLPSRQALATVALLISPALSMLVYSATGRAEESSAKLLKAGQYNPANRTVEMFAAVTSGELEVRLIPKDSTQGRVIITNKADEPLNVKVPAVFAAVPILAQLGGRGGTMSGGMMGGGMMQTMGGGGMMGGMRGGMGGGMGMGMGGGMFNVPAGKTGSYKVPTVCLEHGKPEPHSTMSYGIVPLEEVSEKPGLHELIEALGQGRVPQRVAQAAAWNLNNDMSWERLAAKRIKRANGDSYPYFSPLEMRTAIVVTQAAVATAATRHHTAPETIAPDSTAASSVSYSTENHPR